MKLLELISILRKLVISNGNVNVFLSIDPEGNSFGTIENDCFGVNDNLVIIYPHEEHLDYENLIKRSRNGKAES